MVIRMIWSKKSEPIHHIQAPENRNPNNKTPGGPLQPTAEVNWASLSSLGGTRGLEARWKLISLLVDTT